MCTSCVNRYSLPPATPFPQGRLEAIETARHTIALNERRGTLRRLKHRSRLLDLPELSTYKNRHDAVSKAEDEAKALLSALGKRLAGKRGFDRVVDAWGDATTALTPANLRKLHAVVEPKFRVAPSSPYECMTPNHIVQTDGVAAQLMQAVRTLEQAGAPPTDAEIEGALGVGGLAHEQVDFGAEEAPPAIKEAHRWARRRTQSLTLFWGAFASLLVVTSGKSIARFLGGPHVLLPTDSKLVRAAKWIVRGIYYGGDITRRYSEKKVYTIILLAEGVFGHLALKARKKSWETARDAFEKEFYRLSIEHPEKAPEEILEDIRTWPLYPLPMRLAYPEFLKD